MLLCDPRSVSVSTMPPAAPLSTTSMMGLLRSGKFPAFYSMVTLHLSTSPEDTASALKISRSLATVAYEREIAAETVEKTLEVSERVISNVFEHHPTAEVTDALIKELFDNISYLMTRLWKQKLTSSIPGFSDLQFKLLNKICNKVLLHAKLYARYGELWNYVLSIESQDEAELVSLLEIAKVALNYLMALRDSPNHFSSEKLVDRTFALVRTFGARSKSSTVWRKLKEIPQAVQRSYEFENDIDQVKLINSIYDTISATNPKVLSDWTSIIPEKIREYFIFLTAISNGIGGDLNDILTPLPIMSLSPKAFSLLLSPCFPIISKIPSVKVSAEPAIIHRLVSTLLPFLEKCPPTVHLCRVLEKLDNFMFLIIKTSSENGKHVLETMDKVLSLHFSTLESLEEKDSNQSLWNNLSAYSNNCAVNIFTKKLDANLCDKLIEISMKATERNMKTDAAMASSLRSKLKFRAEVNYYQHKNYHKALRYLALSLAILICHETDEKIVTQKLQDASVFWLQIRRDWLMAEEEACQAVTMFSLLADSQERWAVLRLARLETTWYRGQYREGCDMTQCWVSAAGLMLKNSMEPVDRAMVLLEQTWVFWLGNNNEDMETGVKCATRAAKMLAGSFLEGVALFWRFCCEHGLLRFQVQEAITAAGAEKVVERKEREGFQGEEEREPEPTPAYPGLELSVQQRLTDILERAASVWGSQVFSPSDWLSTKTMCQIMLAAAFQLEAFGHSGVSLLRLVASMGNEGEALEESLIAMTGLLSSGAEVDMEVLVNVSQKISVIKKSSIISCFSSLALSLYLKNKGMLKEAGDLLRDLDNVDALKIKTMLPEMMKAKAKFELSRLKLSLGYQDAGDGELEWSLELGVTAWQQVTMVTRWWETDIRTSHKQEPGLLWLGPYLDILQLECFDHLCTLYTTISSPRELKCYVKLGIKMAQEQCLALRAAEQLLSLASTNLLCEDDVGAGVQLAGTQFILGDVLSRASKGRKVNVDAYLNPISQCQPSQPLLSDKSRIVRTQGQSDLSMSPTFVRHNNNPPEFLQHPDSCSCLPCRLPRLHVLLMRLTRNTASSLALQGDLEAASSQFAEAHSVYKQLKKKNQIASGKTATVNNGDSLKHSYLECLLQEGECLAWQAKWESYAKIETEMMELIGTMTSGYLSFNPRLLVQCEEQRVSVRMMREKQRRADNRATEERELVAKMASTTLDSETPEEIEVTPGCDKASLSRIGRSYTAYLIEKRQTLYVLGIGAPRKNMSSSLGVGDPEDLSKKLSNILSLIPEKEESAEKCEEVDLKTPPVRKRVSRKPKLMIEELAIRTVRKMPKITITEESPTPRKFFKSKDKTDVENSPPNIVTPTIQEKKQSVRTKTKSTTPDEYNMEATDIKPVSRSLKNIGKIQIFDDSQFKTPVKTSESATSTSTATKRSSRKVLPVIGETETPAASSSAKKSTRSSVRKTAKTNSEEGPSKEGSVRKSSRKIKTEEEVTPTVGTRSSRRALNRL